MNIAIIGCGYVGLVSGACFAEFGHSVTCIDNDAEKIRSLSKGECPIYERDLDQLLHENITRKRLQFTTELEQAVCNAMVVFIAVGTPSSRRGNGYTDMGYVHEAARNLAPYLKNYTVVVLKSTVPVGSTRQVFGIIRESNPQAEFDVASNPEFLREGAAIFDFMHPDRIVIGLKSARAEQVLRRVYEPLYLIETPVLVTTPETAELIKYASNAFLATKISFINEMSNLCEAVGADVQALAQGIGLDKRIGPKFLHAGPGFGGSCFPKDTIALARMAQECGAPCRIVETVVESNNVQKVRMVNKIRQSLGEDVHGKTLAVLGLTFKPETDDMRDSPSLMIIPTLLEKGIKIRAHDPVGMEEARKHLPEIEYAPDPYSACDGADAVCLMTEWNPYRALDLQKIKKLLKKPVFIDLRNVYRTEVMAEAGFYYVSVGRNSVNGLK